MDSLNFYKESRPWGGFERFTLNERSTVKIITIHPGETLSLQSHAHRDEIWKIVSGSGTVAIGETRHDAATGDEFFVARGQKHRVIGGPPGIVFLEVALGHFDENDITRFEDKYGRA